MPDISETLRNMNDIFLSTVYLTFFTMENGDVVHVFTATLLLNNNNNNLTFQLQQMEHTRVGNLETFVCTC